MAQLNFWKQTIHELQSFLKDVKSLLAPQTLVVCLLMKVTAWDATFKSGITGATAVLGDIVTDVRIYKGNTHCLRLTRITTLC